MVKYVCVTRYERYITLYLLTIDVPSLCRTVCVRTYVHSNFIIIFSPLLMLVAEREQLLEFHSCRSRFGLIPFPNGSVSIAPDDLLALHDRKYACTFRQFHLLMYSQIKSTPSHRSCTERETDTDIICSKFRWNFFFRLFHFDFPCNDQNSSVKSYAYESDVRVCVFVFRLRLRIFVSVCQYFCQQPSN